jgi:hypothetical protein
LTAPNIEIAIRDLQRWEIEEGLRSERREGSRGCYQRRTSFHLLHLPARLDGLKLAHNAGAILIDAARRHMEMDASMEIAGGCRAGLVPPLSHLH